MTEATQQGATIERLVGILGAQESQESPQTDPAEVPKPEAAPNKVAKPKETPEEVPEAAATESEEPEKSEPEESPAEEPQEDAQEEVTLPTSIQELAEAINVEPEKLYDLKVKTKIDGQEGEVTLAQLIKSYQTEGHITRKSMELSEQRKAFEQEAQKGVQEVQNRLRFLDDSLNIASSIVNERFKSINWDQLKSENPTEFNTRYIEFQHYQQQLAQAYQSIQGERQKAQVEQQKQFLNYVQEEQKKLINAVPEWADKAIAKKEQGEIREYLKSVGISEEEADQIYDHRYITILRDAKKGRELQKSKPEVMKKIAAAPKLVKPGTKPSKDDGKQAQLRDLKKQHKAGNKQAGLNWLKESGHV